MRCLTSTKMPWVSFRCLTLRLSRLRREKGAWVRHDRTVARAGEHAPRLGHLQLLEHLPVLFLASAAVLALDRLLPLARGLDLLLERPDVSPRAQEVLLQVGDLAQGVLAPGGVPRTVRPPKLVDLDGLRGHLVAEGAGLRARVVELGRQRLGALWSKR